MKLGRHAEAICHFDKALGSGPPDSAILFHKAAPLAEMDRHEEAVAYYDKALELDL